MDREYEAPIPVVSCAVLHGDEILLLLRALEPRSGRWAFPAGFVEVGESAEEAIFRELVEETGLIAEVSFHRSFGRVVGDGHAYLSLCFLARVEETEVVVNEESSDWRWVALDPETLDRIDWAFESHRTVAMDLARLRPW